MGKTNPEVQQKMCFKIYAMKQGKFIVLKNTSCLIKQFFAHYEGNYSKSYTFCDNYNSQYIYRQNFCHCALLDQFKSVGCHLDLNLFLHRHRHRVNNLVNKNLKKNLVNATALC